MRSLDRPTTVLLVAAAVHFALTIPHGAAHVSIPVTTVAWQTAYVVIVIFLAPIVGVGFLVRGRVRTAAWLLLAAGIGAFLFEGLAHFVVENPDHVSTVEAGRALFASTATLSLVSDLVLLGTAAWALRRQAHGSDTTSAIDSTT